MMYWLLYSLTYLIVTLGIIHLLRLTLFALGSHAYRLKQHPRIRPTRFIQIPSISIVIPAHNEENAIIKCVDSVVNASYDKRKKQIIVADDGSDDGTAQLVREYIQKHPEDNIVLVSRANAGKAHALNYVIQNHATGELVMCLDADSHADSRALINAARHFEDSRVVALSSNVKIIPTGNLFNLIQVYEYVINYHVKRALTVFNIEYIVGGIGSVFRRSALTSVGYYDTDTITEDIDLTMKLLRLGNKQNRVIYGSDVIMYTEAVQSFGDLIKQRLRWKYGRLQTFIKNADMFFSTDARHAKQLTWLYLPFIIFGEIMFFLEPLMLALLIFLAIAFGDWITISSACAVMSSYIILSILAEDTISWRTKIKLAAAAPAMYVFFYVLNAVEYIALVRTYFNFSHVRKSIREDACKWDHVERAKAA